MNKNHNETINKNIPNKVLILTASGGGGLLTAAIAKEQEAKRNNPNAKVITYDIMKESHIGRMGVKLYNTLQRKGDVFWLVRLTNLQKYFESIFSPGAFFTVLTTLFKHNIDHIIDTQPLSATAIIRAIKLYNKIKKKNVILEKIIVDYPTKYCDHFFRNIRNLSKRNKKLVKIVCLSPLLDPGQTHEQFWHKHTRMSMENISYNGYPIREAFIKYKGKELNKDEPYPVLIRTKNDLEKDYVLANLKRTDSKYSSNNNDIHISLDHCDKMVTILLGAQPAFSGTFDYVKQFYEVSKGLKSNIRYFMFVYCDGSRIKKKNLFVEICKFIKNEKNYPKNIVIVPMSYQNDDVIASLFFRSNVTITRSGGQTGIEIMEVSKGANFIHSEIKNKLNMSITQEDLLKGILKWEGGNALLIQQRTGAEFITPHLFSKYCKSVLASNLFK
jgi:UDP-N-acetylglucosamine:LPS N-acetylglucosamine transferase